MSFDLRYHFYHKKCADKDILPYLYTYFEDYDNWYPGKMSQFADFYINCRKYCTIYDEKNGCFIFEDPIKLFDFATLIPAAIATYITEHYEEDKCFIIWCR